MKCVRQNSWIFRSGALSGTSQFLRDNLCMSPLEIKGYCYSIYFRINLRRRLRRSEVEIDLVAGRSLFTASRERKRPEYGAKATGAFGEQDQCGQATKGVWGMSWRQEAKKGVENCEKPGGAVKRALIPGSPN